MVDDVGLHDPFEYEAADRLGIGDDGTGADTGQPLDAGRPHARHDVGHAVGVHSHRRLREGHAERGEDGVRPVDRPRYRGGVMDVAAHDAKAGLLDREGIRAAGEGDHLVAVAECQPGQDPTGGAVGAEHCELHVAFLSMGAPRTVGAVAAGRTPRSTEV